MTDKVFTALHLTLLSVISALSVDLAYKGVISIIPLPLKQESRAALAVMPGAKSARVKPLSDYAVVDERNLFNLADPMAVDEVVKTEESINVDALAETRLRLKLWGTISGGGKDYSWAIIEDEKIRKQNLYKVGDTVQDAEIKLVLRDRVVVHYKGQDEVLLMEKDKGAIDTRQRSPNGSASRDLPPPLHHQAGESEPGYHQRRLDEHQHAHERCAHPAPF